MAIYTPQQYLCKLLFNTTYEKLGKIHRDLVDELAPKLPGASPAEYTMHIRRAIDDGDETFKQLLYSDAALTSEFPVVPVVYPSKASNGFVIRRMGWVACEDCVTLEMAEAYLTEAYTGLSDEDIHFALEHDSDMKLKDVYDSLPTVIQTHIASHRDKSIERWTLAHLVLRHSYVNSGTVRLTSIVSSTFYPHGDTPLVFDDPLARYIVRKCPELRETQMSGDSITYSVIKEAMLKSCDELLVNLVLCERENLEPWDLTSEELKKIPGSDISALDDSFVSIPLTKILRWASDEDFQLAGLDIMEEQESISICQDYTASPFTTYPSNQPEKNSVYNYLLAVDIIRTCRYYTDNAWDLSPEDTLEAYCEWLFHQEDMSLHARRIGHIFEDTHKGTDLIAPTIGWCCPNPYHVSKRWCFKYMEAVRYSEDRALPALRERLELRNKHNSIDLYLSDAALLACYATYRSAKVTSLIGVDTLPGLYPVKVIGELLRQIPR